MLFLFVCFFTSFKLDLLSCISRISPGIQQFRMWRESNLCGPSAPGAPSTSESPGPSLPLCVRAPPGSHFRAISGTQCPQRCRAPSFMLSGKWLSQGHLRIRFLGEGGRTSSVMVQTAFPLVLVLGVLNKLISGVTGPRVTAEQ